MHALAKARGPASQSSWPGVSGLPIPARAATIGVGRGVASPSLRTGLAGLPHPALQLVVLPSKGLANRGTGVLQAEQPVFGKEGIWPSCVISPVGRCDPSHPDLLTQNAPQPAANPAVDHAERRVVTVQEIAIPALNVGLTSAI